MNDTIYLTVGQDDGGKRLDAFVGGAAPSLSRSHAAKLIEAGYVTRDGEALNKK